MQCQIKLFARARDLAGVAEVGCELPDGATVGDLRRWLSNRFPPLTGLLGRCAVAVREEFADDATRLNEGDEVALLPPVSGGSRDTWDV